MDAFVNHQPPSYRADHARTTTRPARELDIKPPARSSQATVTSQDLQSCRSMNTSPRAYFGAGSDSTGTCLKPTDSYRCTAFGSLVLLPSHSERAPSALPCSIAYRSNLRPTPKPRICGDTAIFESSYLSSPVGINATQPIISSPRWTTKTWPPMHRILPYGSPRISRSLASSTKKCVIHSSFNVRNAVASLAVASGRICISPALGKVAIPASKVLPCVVIAARSLPAVCAILLGRSNIFFKCIKIFNIWIRILSCATCATSSP